MLEIGQGLEVGLAGADDLAPGGGEIEGGLENVEEVA